MSDFDQPTSTLYELPPRRRAASSRFGERIARTFGSFDRTRDELPAWEEDGDIEYPIEDRGASEVALRRRIAELEYELDRVQSEPVQADPIAAEIQRIGEQTSSILIVAHDQATEIKREAQAQADRCLQDAATNAVKMTSEAKQRLSELDAETDSVWRERTRLLEDARGVAAALVSLVDEATRRFPGETDRVDVPRPSTPVSAAPPVAVEAPVPVSPPPPHPFDAPVPVDEDEQVGGEDEDPAGA